MSFRGKKHSQETRAKISAAMRGDRNPMKHPEVAAKLSGDNNPTKRPEVRAKIAAALCGIPLSLEHRAKLSAARKGKHPSMETRTKMSIAKRGMNNPQWNKPHSLEIRKKIADALRGKKYSPERRARNAAAQRRPEVRAKKSVAMLGNNNPSKRPEVRAKMSAALRGDKHPCWRGGISRDPYGWEWSPELREAVRQRDGHRCQLCGKAQSENDRAFDVHHIDYDKKNSDPMNLITLCPLCHSQTGTNRPYWTAFFQAKMVERFRMERIG